ncbi:MAG: HupE/UreJ family protein [Burkholderiales bacterium]|nr:HupE/UreJ family protein [Burkholderiales bacterium]
MTVRHLGCALLAGLACGAARAHELHGAGTGLAAGLLHPVTGLDHVLAMVAVGLWGAVLGPPAIWVLPIAFPVAMAFGALLGMAGMPLPGVEIGIAISALVLGLLVTSRRRLPLPLALALVAAFAVCHGHAHGRELPAGGDALLYSLGFVIATGSLHAAGIALGALDRWPAGRVVVRLAGLGVASGGLWFLWQALR